jgi:hypothetical protein
MSETTKKQHYVWRKYLTPWTNNLDIKTGKVFVYRKTPKGNQSQLEERVLMKIAFENYFYDISGYTQMDINVYKQMLDYFQKDEKLKFVTDFSFLNNARTQKDFIEKEVMCQIEDLENKYKFLEKLQAGDISFYKDSPNQEIINTLEKSFIESIFTQEEVLKNNELVALGERFIQNLNIPDTKYLFNLFVSVQYFRSPKIHSIASEIFEKFKIKLNNSALNTKFYVNLITVYYAQKMALSLTQLPTFILLYDNQTSIPFITCDTPVMNLSDKEDALVLHYPVSPQKALQIIWIEKLSQSYPVKIDENTTPLVLDEKFKVVIESLNKSVFENAYNEVYSNSSEIFKEYLD